MLLQFLLLKLSRNNAPFSLRSQNSEHPRISQVAEANQNTQKLLSTDLLKNTNNNYCWAEWEHHATTGGRMKKSGFCSNLILCGYLYCAHRQVTMSCALAKSA